MKNYLIQEAKSILILDDEMLQAQALGRKLKKGGYQVVDITYTGLRAIESVKKNAPDIVLLDINLSGQQMDGIDVGKAIQAFNKEIIIIYITAYGNDVNFKKALASNPHAFIDKPYQMKTIHREIELAVQQVLTLTELQNTKTKAVDLKKGNTRILCFPDSIWIKNGTAGYQKIAIEEILYLKADGAYTSIVTRDSKIYPIMLLKEFDAEFPYPELPRIHNSYIVNLKNVNQVNVNNKGGKLSINNGDEIPVSKSYATKFQESWSQFLVSRK